MKIQSWHKYQSKYLFEGFYSDLQKDNLFDMTKVLAKKHLPKKVRKPPSKTPHVLIINYQSFQEICQNAMKIV